MKPFEKLKNRLLAEGLINTYEHAELKYHRIYGLRWHIQDGGYSFFMTARNCRLIESYDTVSDLLKAKTISLDENILGVNQQS